MHESNNGFDPKRLERISDWMQRDIDAGHFAGSSVLITRSGGEVYFHSAGLRNVEANLPFQRDSVARIYSMTKPITSVALMMLVERGLVHLDAPLSDFLPAFNEMHALVPNATDIDQTEPSHSPTLHQLLTHTSGMSYPFNSGVLPRAMERENIFFKPDQGQLSAMTDQLAALPLAFQPGRRWEYSVSIDVLGRVIEVVSGKIFAEFLSAEILTPLEMSTTGFSVPDGVGDKFASLYTPLVGEAVAQNPRMRIDDSLHLMEDANGSPFRSSSMQSGGGGLVSTIDDYMIFAEMLRQGGAYKGTRLLSPSTVSFMKQNHLPNDIASMGPSSFAGQTMQGLGFGLGGAVVLNPARARCPGSIGDYSWGGMASTFFWIDRVLDLNVVFFTQLVPSSAYPARSKLKALVHGALER
ncbi:MAG: CubicO group peptidase (beta-lactamase class C family) [Granulosicoccus sp.]|jgi:CubicO group peptidase (beta-lactamase class C family)